MPQLEESAATWASYTLTEAAKRHRREAKAARERGAKHLPIKAAAEFVAASHERAAIAMERDAAQVGAP